MPRICIAGGGNLGTLLAAEWSARGEDVAVYTRRPELWKGSVRALDTEGNVLCEGTPSLVTDDPRVFAETDLAIVTHPTHVQAALAEALLPFVHRDLVVCVIPGALAEFTFGEVRRAGARLWGFERVPAIARIGEPGRSAIDLGTKPSVSVASIPGDDLPRARGTLQGLLPMPVDGIGSYLALSLIPSNPVLHTTRLATLFRDWHPGRTFGENPAFYETWDDASSTALIEADVEVQRLCRRLEEEAGREGISLDLSAVRSLTVHYESPTVEAMTAKIRSIAAFKGLPSPMIRQADGRWIPDLTSRYFRSDFAYGLKAIIDIAGLVDLPVPRLEATLDWYRRVTAEAGQEIPLFDGMPGTLEGLWAVYR